MYTQRTKSGEQGELFSFASAPTNGEKVSTSSDGKQPTKETPRLNTVYEGPEGKITASIMYGLVWVFARFDLDLHSRSNILRTAEVTEAFFSALRDKGVRYVYCIAEGKSAVKFNEMLGWTSTNTVIHDKYEVMEKEL